MHTTHLGVFDGRGDNYTLSDRILLIDTLGAWGGNLLIYGILSWKQSIRKMSAAHEKTFALLADQCRKHDVEIWAWMKPGDHRYCFHRSDRAALIENAKRYRTMGASGLVLMMDDLHPTRGGVSPVREKDAEYHRLLIDELCQELPGYLRMICGEHYWGKLREDHPKYWDLLLTHCPQTVSIAWTGPGIWNKKLHRESVPSLDHPLFLFENFFASDSKLPERAPIYPYKGRSPDLSQAFRGVVLNTNYHLTWNLAALYTYLSFWKDPHSYDADKAFKEAIMSISDRYGRLYGSSAARELR